MGDALNRARALPRAAAAGFASSGALTGLCMCLALSAGFTLISALQAFLDPGAELLFRSPALFDVLYAIAAVFLAARLWRVKSDVRGENTQKASVASLVLFGVLLAGTVYIGVFYFSVYTTLEAIPPEELQASGMTEADVRRLWEMLPLFVFPLGIQVLQAVCFLLFRFTLKRVAELFRGLAQSGGAVRACFVLSALTAGFCVCEGLLPLTAGADFVSAGMNVVFALADAGVFLCMAFLCRGTAAGMRGAAAPVKMPRQ